MLMLVYRLRDMREVARPETAAETTGSDSLMNARFPTPVLKAVPAASVVQPLLAAVVPAAGVARPLPEGAAQVLPETALTAALTTGVTAAEVALLHDQHQMPLLQVCIRTQRYRCPRASGSAKCAGRCTASPVWHSSTPLTRLCARERASGLVFCPDQQKTFSASEKEAANQKDLRHASPDQQTATRNWRRFFPIRGLKGVQPPPPLLIGKRTPVGEVWRT